MGNMGNMGKYFLALGIIAIMGLLTANLLAAQNTEEAMQALNCAPRETVRAADTAAQERPIAPAQVVASQGRALSSLIASVQESMVKIDMPGSRGSGVILSHENGQTVIVTNKHVIDPAKNTGAINVYTSAHERIKPAAVYIAPKEMDLAIVVLDGTYGTPAQIAQSEYWPGDDVIALGSPRGIQGSVSKGIVSNLGDDKTKAGYAHDVIQTDTAINTGNSGGGLFLAHSGELIGINTFQMKNAEGLNFAIDIRELSELGDYWMWEEMD